MVGAKTENKRREQCWLIMDLGPTCWRLDGGGRDLLVAAPASMFVAGAAQTRHSCRVQDGGGFAGTAK